MAVERARALTPVRMEMVFIADDTALTSADKTAGRRGLSGGKFALKIAGAMAEEGKSLDEILNMLHTKILPNLGTIGLSLGPCILPGRSQPTFSLGQDEMELGLGVKKKLVKFCVIRRNFFLIGRNGNGLGIQ